MSRATQQSYARSRVIQQSYSSSHTSVVIQQSYARSRVIQQSYSSHTQGLEPHSSSHTATLSLTHAHNHAHSEYAPAASAREGKRQYMRQCKAGAVWQGAAYSQRHWSLRSRGPFETLSAPSQLHQSAHHQSDKQTEKQTARISV